MRTENGGVRWARRVAASTAVVTLIFSSVLLVAWLVQSPQFLRFNDGDSFISFNAVICSIIATFGLLAVITHYRRAALGCGLILLLIGAWTLIQQLSGGQQVPINC